MSYQKNIKHVKGKNKTDLFIFALSTCVWCQKTKKLLKNLKADFRFVDVDFLNDKDREEVRREIIKCNPSLAFPTIKNGKTCIIGYDEEKLTKIVKK
jgi:glutaredoxin